MNLLEFARGPALEWAFIIFIAGISWRLIGTLFLLRHKSLSKPRDYNKFYGGLRTIVLRSWPRNFINKDNVFPIIMGYILHIGLFIIVFLFIPHILFFKSLFGFEWPGIPNDLVMLTAAITIAALIAMLIRRITNPVLKAISTADDYITWFVTFLPILTGILAYAHFGARYETMLAIHFLSVALLMIWFPFGKLMHAILVFPSRGQMGALFIRRGVKL